MSAQIGVRAGWEHPAARTLGVDMGAIMMGAGGSGGGGWRTPVTRARSTGRCNTIQRLDSTMLSRENRSVGLHAVKHRVPELIEFAAGRGLLRAAAAGGDVGEVVVFAADGAVGDATEHGELADVVEGVGDWALE